MVEMSLSQEMLDMQVLFIINSSIISKCCVLTIWNVDFFLEQKSNLKSDIVGHVGHTLGYIGDS